MLLRSGRQQLGANVVQGIFQGSPPTPGTVASALGVTSAPIGTNPRPMLFATPPMSVDYAYPTVPPVPTAAGQINQGMQPMGPPAGGPDNSGGAGYDPNMPLEVLHGVPSSLANPTPSYDLPTPPPADTGTGTATGQLQLTGDTRALQVAPPTFANLINPFSPQRSLPLIAGVAGGGALLLVLLLRR
jgi:hypothetical protein